MAKKKDTGNIATGELTRRMARVKNAEAVRDRYDREFGFSDCIKMYNGKFKDVLPSWIHGIDMVPINEVYAYAKTFVPSVFSRDPYMTVNPRGTKFILGSKILELAVNAYWRELRLKNQIRRCLFDAIFCEGILKIGYSSSLGRVTKEDGEKSIRPSEYIRKDEIFAQRVSFRNFVRDPDAVDGLHDARWCAHQIILPLEAVKASSLYENTEDLNPNFTQEIVSPTQYRGGPEYKTEEQYVVLWEEWNRDEEMVYTYAEGYDKYLMNKKWPYKFTGFPFEMIRFNESGDQPYAPNLISPWLPQLWEKIKIRSMELDHIKRFGRQMIMEEGSLSKIQQDKFKKGITGSILEFKSGKTPPQPIAYPPIQTDMYGVENRIDVDKDTISGQPNVVRSAPQKTTSRTLGEVDRLISAFQSRQNDPQSIVEDFSEEVAKKIIGLMQQYFKENKYLRVTGADMKFLQREAKDNPASDRLDRMGFLMNPDDIKNIDFEVEVRAGSTLPLDRKGRTTAMTSIVELGEKIGIQPGGKVSKVIGKNLVAEFDMPEINAAYEEDLAKMENAAIMAQAAQQMKNNQLYQRVGQASQKVSAMGNGINGAKKEPIIPEEIQ